MPPPPAAAATAASASGPAAGVATWRQDPIVRAFDSTSTSRGPPGVRSVKQQIENLAGQGGLSLLNTLYTCIVFTAYSFGTAPRASLAAANAAGIPGPGQYALPSNLIKRGGGFSLRGRVRFGSLYGDNAESRTKDTRPGPVGRPVMGREMRVGSAWNGIDRKPRLNIICT